MEEMITNLNELCERSLAFRVMLDNAKKEPDLCIYSTYSYFLDFIYNCKSELISVAYVYCWDLKLVSDMDLFSILDEIDDLFNRLVDEYGKKYYDKD